MKYIIALLLPIACFANVTMNPGGKSYNVDAYGADRRPTRDEFDAGLDSNRRAMQPIHRASQLPLNGVRFNTMVAE